jgi:hypothetical protein
MDPIEVSRLINDYNMETVLLIKSLFHYLQENKELLSPDVFFHLDLLLKQIITIDPQLHYLPKKITVFLRTLIYQLNLNTSREKLVSNLNHVFLLMLDSYFEYLEPFKAKLSIIPYMSIFMPRLACSINLVDTDLVIEKSVDHFFLINGKKVSSFDKKQVLLDNMKVIFTSQENYMSLFCNIDLNYLSLLSADSLDPCEYRKLQQALIAIAIADPNLYNNMKNLVEFFIVLKKVTHHSTSFTLKSYAGLVFLSCNTDEFAIAENIIREFYNSVMNISLKLEYSAMDNRPQYFTPYAESPSTPTNLLRNILIFVEVCQFFTHCLKHNNFKDKFSLLGYRLTVQLYRMKLALEQTAKIQWSSYGNELLNRLRICYEHLRIINQQYLLPRPIVIEQHINRWRKNYTNSEVPNLTSSLIEING